MRAERARKSNKWAQLSFFFFLFFFFNFSKSGTFRMVQPPQRYVVLKVLTDNQGFHFSKKAMRANTACNK